MPSYMQIVLFCIALVFHTPKEIKIAKITLWQESSYKTTASNPYHGHDHIGIGQVDPFYWGPVPYDLMGQLRQIKKIVDKYGWKYWDGAPSWAKN